MSTYLDGNPWGNVAWNGDTYSTNDKERDTYFRPDGKGNHVLKDGYESRYLGSGENVSSNGAISTYTNAFDDNHDDYNADSDRKNYGIFKLPEAATPVSTPASQASAPVAAPKSTPKPKSKPEPVEYSPEIKQAKERVQTYENNIMSGKTSDDIYGVGSNSQNYAKDSYINHDFKGFQQHDFNSKTFNGQAETAKQNSQDFLSQKKNNLINSM